MKNIIHNLITKAKDREKFGDINGAINIYEKLLNKDPGNILVQIEIANLHAINKNYYEAAKFFRKLLSKNNADEGIKKGLSFCLTEIGNNHQEIRQFQLAEVTFTEALTLYPNDPNHLYNYGNALLSLNKLEEAINAYQNSIKNTPSPDAEKYNNLGNSYRRIGKNTEAIEAYKIALEINPCFIHTKVELTHLLQNTCEWKDINNYFKEIKEYIHKNNSGKISPFTTLSMPNFDSQDHLDVASSWAQKNKIKKLTKKKIIKKKKINIGYLSADFRKHPLYFLIFDILVNHDQDLFNIKLFYSGSDLSSDEYYNFKNLKHKFINIHNMSDKKGAEIVMNEEIDILIDLSGFTQNSRSMIAAYKPARYHINWLGFAGSLGFYNEKPLFDFLLADKYIIPKGSEGYYAEEVLYLQHCYQPNIENRPPLTKSNKENYGFEKDTFIFASFGQPIKITESQFCLWIKILKNTPQSNLWLLDANEIYKKNLWQYAEKNNIQRNRIKFAPKVEFSKHINRQSIIDLFLDTFPYNAHTSTSDAIWAECPVLTLSGKTFASRVAGSILTEIDCQEMITDNENQYYEKALMLYKNPNELLKIKKKIIYGKNNSYLFKPKAFTKNLEEICKNLLSS